MGLAAAGCPVRLDGAIEHPDGPADDQRSAMEPARVQADHDGGEGLQEPDPAEQLHVDREGLVELESEAQGTDLHEERGQPRHPRLLGRGGMGAEEFLVNIAGEQARRGNRHYGGGDERADDDVCIFHHAFWPNAMTAPGWTLARHLADASEFSLPVSPPGLREGKALTVVLRAAACERRPALVLHPWCRQDVQDLIDIYSDPVIYEAARNPIVTEKDAHRWLEAQQDGWASGRRLSFAVLYSEAASCPITWLATSC